MVSFDRLKVAFVVFELLQSCEQFLLDYVDRLFVLLLKELKLALASVILKYWL